MTEITLDLPYDWRKNRKKNNEALDTYLTTWKGKVTGEGDGFLVLEFENPKYAEAFARNINDENWISLQGLTAHLQ